MGSSKTWQSVLAGAICIFVWDSNTNSAYAYLDPGTGTMLLQGIIAAVSGVVAVVLTKLKRIRDFIRSRRAPEAGTTSEEASANDAEREPGAR